MYFKTRKDLSCRDRRTLVVLSHLPHSSFYTTQCSYMPRQPPHIPHAGCDHQLRSGQRGMSGSCVSLLDHAFKGPSPWSFPSSHWLVCRHGSRHHSSVFNHKWMLCVAHSTVTRQKKSVSLKPWSIYVSPGMCAEGPYVREMHVYNKVSTISTSAGSNLLFSDEETENRETKGCVPGQLFPL